MANRMYPIGVLNYAKYVSNLYNQTKGMRDVCLAFGITKSLLIHAVAEASERKLIRDHDVELTMPELIIAITDAAVSVFLMDHMDEVQITCINNEGELDWIVPKHLAEKMSGIAAIAIDLIKGD